MQSDASCWFPALSCLMDLLFCFRSFLGLDMSFNVRDHSKQCSGQWSNGMTKCRVYTKCGWDSWPLIDSNVLNESNYIRWKFGRQVEMEMLMHIEGSCTWIKLDFPSACTCHDMNKPLKRLHNGPRICENSCSSTRHYKPLKEESGVDRDLPKVLNKVVQLGHTFNKWFNHLETSSEHKCTHTHSTAPLHLSNLEPLSLFVTKAHQARPLAWWPWTDAHHQPMLGPGDLQDTWCWMLRAAIKWGSVWARVA